MREDLKDLFIHYFKNSFNGYFDKDNEIEVANMIDDLIDTIKAEIKEEEELQSLKRREQAGEDACANSI